MHNKIEFKHSTLSSFIINEHGEFETEILMIVTEIIDGVPSKRALHTSFRNKFSDWNFDNARYFNINWN